MNSKAKIFVILLTAGILSGCLADIRPEALKSDLRADADTRGRQLLREVIDAHGGLDNWKQARTVEFVARDHWEHWMGRIMFMPQEESGQLMRWQTSLGGDQAFIEMQEGPNKGERWVMQGWPMYRAQPGGQPDYGAGRKIHFYVASMNYALQMPFRSANAEIVRYGGQSSLRGREYDLIYITWQSAEPQKDVNQYVLWVDPRTHELEYLQLTDRELMKAASGFMEFGGWRTIDGLKVPSRITSYKDVEKNVVMHELVVESAAFGVELRREARSKAPAPVMGEFGRRKTRY
ncbi:MAG: hypothetical protein HY579_13875 [Nitrospinae bacterium]|nr:hypothetical protein [Nitrospinota bacterium]